MLKKPFILTILLIQTAGILGHLVDLLIHSFWIVPIPWILASVIIGFTYSIFQKNKFSHSERKKIALYFLLFNLMPFFLSVILLKSFNNASFYIACMLTLIGFFIYIALDWGCIIGVNFLETAEK